MTGIRNGLLVAVLAAIFVVLVDFDHLILTADRSLSTAANDVHATSLAVNERIAQVDPLLAKAEKSLDSLDRAIKTHEAATRRASDELHGTFQNANAVLIQAGLTSDEVRLASMEQRQGLLESNRKLTAALEESRLLLADIRARVNDPAIQGTVADVNATTTEIREAVYEMRHPPKKTRGQKVLGFVLNLILSNAVQGAVRR